MTAPEPTDKGEVHAIPRRMEKALAGKSATEHSMTRGQSRIPELAELYAFEYSHGLTHTGQKEDAIRRTFGLPASRYYQTLNRTIDTREAIEYDPHMTAILLDRRYRAKKARQARTTAHEETRNR